MRLVSHMKYGWIPFVTFPHDCFLFNIINTLVDMAKSSAIFFWRVLISYLLCELVIHMLLLVSIERKSKWLGKTYKINVSQSNEVFSIGTFALHDLCNLSTLQPYRRYLSPTTQVWRRVGYQTNPAGFDQPGRFQACPMGITIPRGYFLLYPYPTYSNLTSNNRTYINGVCSNLRISDQIFVLRFSFSN